MSKVTIPSGLELEVRPETLDNMELVDALCDLNDGSALATSKVMRLLLDEDTRRTLYDHLRTEDGRVPVVDVARALTDIIAAMGSAGKN